MNKSNFALVVALVAVIIASLAYFKASDFKFGATGTRFPNGVSADTTSPVAGELRGDDLTLDDDATITDDLTVNGGAVEITSSNAATSSLTVGCRDGYATSTETPIKYMLFSSSTLYVSGATVSTNFGGGTMRGLVLWGYGSC